MAAIERSKQQPFNRVLYALGIPGIGYVNARALASHFGSIDSLMKATAEEIEAVEGIGPVLAGVISETLAEPRNKKLIEELRGPGSSSSRSGQRAAAGSAGGKDVRADRHARGA